MEGILNQCHWCQAFRVKTGVKSGIQSVLEAPCGLKHAMVSISIYVKVRHKC